jgi:ornithine decarboxylase
MFDTAADMVAALEPDAPVYCLRPHVLREAARRFTQTFPGDVLYAVKCNDDPRVLRALHEGGVRRFEVASLHEVAVLHATFAAPECAFMHPVKSRRAIAEAYRDYGVRTFAFDHADELAKLEAVTNGGRELTLAVRLDVSQAGALHPLGGKFGATADEAVALLRAAAAPGRRLGLTFHVGSQCLEPAAFRRAIALAAQVQAQAGVGLDLLDVGGGFPAAYVGVDPPAPAAYMAAIREAVTGQGLPPTCRLACEPGRALVADGCSMVVRVELRRGNALYLNDGVYGSLYDMKHQGLRFPMRLVRPGRTASQRLTGFRLFGPTCDSTDSLPGLIRLPEDVGEGDWIEIGQVGAYGHVLCTRFNGFHPDTTVAVRDGAFRPDHEAAAGDMIDNDSVERVAA